MQQVPQTLSYLQEKAAGPCTTGGSHEGIPSMPTPTLLSVFDERNCLLEVIHACTELEWNSPTPGYQRYLCLHNISWRKIHGNLLYNTPFLLLDQNQIKFLQVTMIFLPPCSRSDWLPVFWAWGWTRLCVCEPCTGVHHCYKVWPYWMWTSRHTDLWCQCKHKEHNCNR